MKKKVLVLGCTGSIGSQTLDIIRHEKDSFEVAGLSVGHNQEALESLCSEFKCKGTCWSNDGLSGLKKLLDECGADIAVNGVAGSQGLLSSVEVLERGMNLALANKESVVMAWPVIKQLALKKHASIVPVDSEHSAVFNLVNQLGKDNTAEIVITASGGPFRNFTREQLESVTVEDALKHPTWNMGKKITIDSASLANKGLEVIEACRLFDVDTDKVKVLVHPQSIVHSLVRSNDGMLYAQISDPDMRHPIYSALVWPENRRNHLKPFTLAGHELSFFEPRTDDFPMLALAYECARKSGSYTIAFNAANEIAVEAFIDKKIGFLDIPGIVGATLSDDWTKEPASVEAVLEADRLSHERARNILDGRTF